MRHIRQQDIDPKLRRPHLKRLRTELTTVLQSPGLPAEQRRLLHERLTRLGKPKIYRADNPHPAGAVDGGPMPREPEEITLTLDRESLAQTRKVTLLAYAAGHNIGVEPGSTKAQIVQAILQTKENV